MRPWIEKYKPEKLADFVGNQDSFYFLKTLIQEHKQTNKPLFLFGGIGNGKSSSIQVLANELNLEYIELNASDTRNKKGLEEFLSNVLKQGSLFGTKKIIVLDELDGLSGKSDRGALSSIINLCKKSKYPVVLIAQDAYSDKLKKARKVSELIKFNPLSSEEIYSRLKYILERENVEFEEKAVKQIARMSGGDLRSSINDIQSLSDSKITFEKVQDLSDRNRTDLIEDSLNLVYKTKSADIALRAYDNVSEDLDKIFLWVVENTKDAYLDPKDLSTAYNNIALADVFFGRIRRWQHYRFYVYCYALLSAGISLSKNTKYTHKMTYKRSSLPLKIWIANNANKTKKDIAQKIASKSHNSFSSILKDINYLSLILRKEEVADHFELNKEEKEWIKKLKVI